MRIGVLALALLAAGCAAPKPTYFKNPEHGTVVEACTPAPGLAFAVRLAQQACIEAYEKQGWVEIAGPGRSGAPLQ